MNIGADLRGGEQKIVVSRPLFSEILRVPFGSKQAVLREKLAHKAEDNIGLSQTTQSIIIIISHGGGSCSEC